ncbi:MAG TPA: dihydrolipoamide acetyltransferase family protein [Solirubrobacterales bacterium]|nr:dihydrolipoamide acetyltransferase family protein [Solirubrobacterales bacterium]
MSEVVMPRLSDSMEEGTILTWLKQVGDEVAVGDELVEIETDKANMAYESDVAGTLQEILAQEGETLPIGSPIARIGESNGAGSDSEGQSTGPAGPVTAGDPPSLPVAKASSEMAPPTVPPAGGASEADSEGRAEVAADGGGNGSGERVKASPLARRLARDKGVDLKDLHGSGPGGRIIKHDVEEATPPTGVAVGGTAPEEALATGRGGGSPAAAGPVGQQPSSGTAKGETEVREPNKLQQTIARRMAESKATAPHFYLTIEVDMGKAVEARAAIKATSKEGDVVPSFNDMIVKACAIALREFPKANGAYRDGRYELYSRVNVGVAVAAEEALVVPTIFDADRKGLRQIAADTRAVAAKVRDGSVTPPELSGGTFTVSNLGMYGIDEFDAVINMGQAAILAVGAIREVPAVRGGEVVPARLMKATLSCDHRILYGAEGAEFLARVKQLLEEPVSLAL